MSPFAEDLKQRIEAAYAESGNSLGWRLLHSPAPVLDGARVAFVGLNPGGGQEPPDHPRFATRAGSAYVSESWKGAAPGQDPLQRQVRALFASLGVAPEQVLAGNLVPFRSPRWSALPNRRAALAFGRALWAEILDRAGPSLIVAMGGEAQIGLRDALDAGGARRIPVGWGDVAATRSETRLGPLIGLPHLSRFRIVGRPESAAALREIFAGHWRG